MFLIKTQASHCLQTWDTFQLRLTYTNRHHAEKTAKCLYYRWRELNLQLKIFEVPLDWYKARFKALCENRTTEKKAGWVKAWPNARNISTQHLATLLGTTCCVRLATLLRYVACVWPVHSTPVATSCNKVARCCVEMFRAFGQALRRWVQVWTTVVLW